MLGLNNLKPIPGSRKKRKRLGRGEASGLGKTSGKGHKGTKARSGGTIPAWFEGGQMPLIRRLPKRGFKNIFAQKCECVNIGALDIFDDGTVVTLDLLKENKLCGKSAARVKVLGNGECTKKLHLKLNKYSKSVKTMVEGLGGTLEELNA